MLEGVRINLRPWQIEDLPKLTELRNDVVLQGQLLARPRGSTTEQVHEWLQSFKHDPQSIFLIVADKKNVLAGFVHVKGIDTLNQNAELGIGMISSEVGKGFGSEAIQIVSKYLQLNWNLRKLVLQVRSDNLVAIGVYNKSGFRSCGQYSEHVYIDGQWRDITLMELFLQ
jgi:diamine N-acetyltransferase